MWQAKVHRPDGILAGTDLWDDVSIDADTPSIPYPFQSLNIKTHGIRRGELVTICAGSGVGKSQVCKEIAYHLINQGQSIGYIALEENVKRTALGLMGLALDKPLHLSKEGVSDDDLRSIGGMTADKKGPEINYTDAQYTALREVLEEQQELFGDDTEVKGHTDFDSGKTCPNFDAALWFETGELKQTF